MIVYLDTSVLVKRYVKETGTPEFLDLIEGAEAVGSVVLTHVEMAAALSKAVRLQWVDREEAETAWNDFLEDWLFIARISLTPAALERAARLAWSSGLRGYDAVHLAAALSWQDGLETPVVLATFDKELWLAAEKAGMAVWPEER